MNLLALMKGLKGIIPGGLSLKDFSMLTQTSEAAASEILDNLMQNGIGTYDNGIVRFGESARLRTGILAMKLGATIEDVSRLLNWQDFESLAAEILNARDFETFCNIVLTKPRMQIDVVGVKNDLAILIDCKHWKRMSQSALEKAVIKQVDRTKHYVARERIRAAVPAIVTLYEHETKFIKKVPIVPIHKLDSFCEELYGSVEGL